MVEIEKMISETSEKLGISPTIPVMLSVIGARPETIINSMVAQVNIKETTKAETENPPQNKPIDYTEIESIIHDMLTENTGTHMLDSGGAYGRKWQRNRHITDFRQTHPLTVEIDKYGIEYTIHVFPYLTEQLEHDSDCVRLENRYKHYCEKTDQYIGYSSIEGFVEEKLGSSAMGENTYNRDSILSQVLQYSIFTYNGDKFIALQIHGGCDVRGGYTDPRFFKLGWCEDYLRFDTDINASCGCVSVYTDDLYNWYKDADNRKPGKQFDLCGKRVKNEPLFRDSKELPKFWIKEENDKTGQYTGEYQLRCKYCNELVVFGGCV